MPMKDLGLRDNHKLNQETYDPMGSSNFSSLFEGYFFYNRRKRLVRHISSVQVSSRFTQLGPPQSDFIGILSSCCCNILKVLHPVTLQSTSEPDSQKKRNPYCDTFHKCLFNIKNVSYVCSRKSKTCSNHRVPKIEQHSPFWHSRC